MQYQLVLIVFNIVIALAAYFFLRDRRNIFRLIIMPVVYAYFLAAFLPYLLAFVPVNWVIAFYTVAILLGFLAKGIDSRVQPDIEDQDMDSAVWSETDLDYIEARSEREALLSTVKFSKTKSDNDAPLFSRILSESTTSLKNTSSSELYETSQPVLESTLLGGISQLGSASASNRSGDIVSQKPAPDDNKHEAASSRSTLSPEDTQEVMEKSAQLSMSEIRPHPQQEEKPAQKSTYVLRDPASDQQVEEAKPILAEPAATPHATVSYLSEYKEEKAALASAAGSIMARPIEPVQKESLPPVSEPVLNEVLIQPAAEIELNKKAVEEIAQKFAYKISNGHQEEILPAQEQEISLTAAKLSDTAGGREMDNEETQEIHQEPIVSIKSDEIPPKIAVAISEAPAERHLELVEASRDQRPEENDPEEFEGVAPLLTNQQIPVGDAGEMVLDKESINDQQEATEDDLMQLDLALVIDRAFQAKFNSDYQKAIRIFEVALNRTPSPKLAQMIAEDIEVMRSKLA
ncbi:MAG: hypothetical protein ABRQ26_05620 [Syntrophomonadaceae bacterium]